MKIVWYLYKGLLYLSREENGIYNIIDLKEGKTIAQIDQGER